MNHTNFSPYSSSPETKVEQYSPNSQLGIMMPAQPAPVPSKGKPKPRKRVNTAEKRHQHNAVERQRRETLNSKFFVLARLLPSLAKSARPSKSSIVNGSISHLTKQRDQRLLAARLLRQLCAERDELAQECNEWRAASGYAGGREAVAASAWTDEMDEVCAVEKETFGEFAIEEGDEGEDAEEQDEGMDVGVNGALAMGIEQATAAVARFDTTAMGLITPRSSTEIDPLTLALGLSMPLADMPQATQPVDITWPSNFSFTPSLSAEPLAMNQHQLQRSSSGSLPFAAPFMSESSSGSPTGSLLGGIPTPPTTNDYSQFTHTPSPRSSGSFDEKSHMQRAQPQAQFSHTAPPAAFTQPRAQWSQQDQLLFLHSIQQQQLQHSQLAELQNTQRVPTASPAIPFGRSQSAGSETFAQAHQTQNVHSSRQSLPLYPSTLQQMQMQQQHIQSQQIMLQQQAAAMSAGGNGQGMPMSRMSSEQMEAWRKIAMGSGGGGGGGARAELGMWAQNALKSF